MKSLKFFMCDSTNKPAMSVKKSSADARARRQSVPSYVGPITVAMDEVFTSIKRRKIS